VSIDVVVVNYHTPDDLDRFLTSLEDYPSILDASLTIVEVDAGEDYSYRFWWNGQNRGQTIGIADNIGYGRACNLAAAVGSGDVIAFFNADIILTPGALDACADALMEHDDWAVLGPCQIDSGNRIRHGGIFGTHTKPVFRGWNDGFRNQYDDIAEAVTVSGSAYFVKRSVWRELTACSLFRDIADEPGAMLPTPHYYEETWVSWHAWGHGYKVIYYGPVVVIHQWHRASPVGGWADQQLPISREMFRKACDHHDLPHD
jgi:GT2 family glycosyltransferase